MRASLFLVFLVLLSLTKANSCTDVVCDICPEGMEEAVGDSGECCKCVVSTSTIRTKPLFVGYGFATWIDENYHLKSYTLPTLKENYKYYYIVDKIPEGEFFTISWEHYACAIDLEYLMHCWGTDDETKWYYVPEDAYEKDTKFKAVEVTLAAAFGLTIDGSLRAWGVKVPDISGATDKFIQIQVSRSLKNHESCFCGLTVDGYIRCFGDYWQKPPADSEGPFSKITMARMHGCALKSKNKKVVCWGDWPLFSNMPEDLQFDTIQATEGATCGVKTIDKTLKCWGTTHYKKCDAPTTGEYSHIYSGHQGRVTLAKKVADGKLSCWGGNKQGPLGWDKLCEFFEGDDVSLLPDEIEAPGESSCSSVESALETCELELDTKTNELNTCVASLQQCSSDLAISNENLMKMTSEKNMWQNMFEEVEAIDYSRTSASDARKKYYKSEEEDGVAQINNENYHFSAQKIAFLTIGSFVMGNISMFMVMKKRKGDESVPLLSETL